MIPFNLHRNKLAIKIFLLIVLILLGVGVFMIFHHKTIPEQKPAPEVPATSTPQVVERVIGNSVKGRTISAYTYGTGKNNVTFVGGMHGGYEWNAVLVAYTLMDYLKVNPNVIPKNLSVTVIPDLNPDGVYTVLGTTTGFTVAQGQAAPNPVTGRKNANNVDLNRNFGCHWQPKSTWQNRPESAGTSAFSEPEAQAMRDFALTAKPLAVIFFHSASGAVYASECDNGVLPQTIDIMNAYSNASGYGAVKSFDAYPITGDSEGWLASIGIPALTVEFSTHNDLEWEKNEAGIIAVLNYYAEK